MHVIMCCFFFKQKTAYELRISDWSSDVCSSDLACLPVRHPAAALVGADVAEVLAEEPHPVRPDRAVQVVLQVGQPRRRLDQPRPAPDLGPGQPDPVIGGDVVDALLHGMDNGESGLAWPVARGHLSAV